MNFQLVLYAEFLKEAAKFTRTNLQRDCHYANVYLL